MATATAAPESDKNNKNKKAEVEERLKTPAFPAHIDGAGAHWDNNENSRKWCQAYSEYRTLKECIEEQRFHDSQYKGAILEDCVDCPYLNLDSRPPAKRGGPPEGFRASGPENKLPKILCHLYYEFFTLRQCRDIKEYQAHEREECTGCSWRNR